jgi:hypothetical protein
LVPIIHLTRNDLSHVGYGCGVIFIGIAVFVSLDLGLDRLREFWLFPGGMAGIGMLLCLAGRFMGERGLKLLFTWLAMLTGLAGLLKGYL